MSDLQVIRDRIVPAVVEEAPPPAPRPTEADTKAVIQAYLVSIGVDAPARATKAQLLALVEGN